jgi:RES domain
MRCCEACFDDPVLTDYIQRHGRRGSCRFCRRRGLFTVEVGELEELFTRFTDIHSPVRAGENVPADVDAIEVGELLATLIQERWGIFSERLTASDRHHDLLRRIFTANCREEEILDAPGVRDLWTDRDMLHMSLLDRWHELAEELKHPELVRPIAPDLPPPDDELEIAEDPLNWFADDLDRASITRPAGSPIFRVRLGCREQEYGGFVEFPAAEMGAPPPERVTEPGRANPIGTSYFYCAEEEQTAVSEKRPHRGALMTIGAGETLRERRLLDLAAGMHIPSPFACSRDYFRGLLESCELFNHLNEQFATPLRRTDDVHEYLPTQFFATWARDHHYDGLRYGSAMARGGNNIVLFDPGGAIIRTVRLAKTDEVRVEYSDYEGED